MPEFSRRQHLAHWAAFAATCTAGPLQASIAPQEKFDLVIKGGEVVDPSQGLRGLRDVGLRLGRVESISDSIPANRARRVIDARGRLVLPGLIDLHTHVYPFGTGIGTPADNLAHQQGTTTTVSAGDAGGNNIAAFRRSSVASARSRLYAFLHIGNVGLARYPAPELADITAADVALATRKMVEHADFVIGAKVRMSQSAIARHGVQPLKLAIAACEAAGLPMKLIVHIGGLESPRLMSEILDRMRPGDVLTHSFSAVPNPAGQDTSVLQGGRLLPAAREAKRRGVLFDVGHGGGFNFDVAEAAIAQGGGPDVISSDFTAGSRRNFPYLPGVMSKFIALGFTLEQVVSMATANAARVIDRLPGMGTLKIGAPADVSIVEWVDEPVEFSDHERNKRTGKGYLRAVAAVADGVPYLQADGTSLP